MRTPSDSDTARDRIEAIQWFRGVAVLLVIGLHSIELVKFRHQQLGEPLGLLSASTFYDQFGASGVDLFFVISGFVMAHILESLPPRDWMPFVSARLRRILPLYWLATIAMAGLLSIVHSAIDPNSALVSILVWPLPGRSSLHAPILVVGWSLAFELAFYAALIPTIFAPVSMRKLMALLIVASLGLAGQLIRPSDKFLALFFNAIWYEFAIGLLLHSWWRRGLESGPARTTAIFGSILLGVGIFVWIIPETRPFAIYDHSAALDRALYWAVPWAGILAWALTITHRGWLSHVMLRIGNASYALYLTHMLVTTSLLKLLPAHVLGADLLPVVAVALALLVGLLTHEFIEQPLLAFMRRVRPFVSMQAPA